MNYELNICIDNLPAVLYMQTGFFDHKELKYPIHSHSYSEIHIFLAGSAVLEYDRRNIDIAAGEVFLVPANKYHRYRYFSSESRRVSFLIKHDAAPDAFKKSAFQHFFVPLLCSEIDRYRLYGFCNKLKALISYICSDLFESEGEALTPVMDREFIIREFFSKKYDSNIRLDDLAAALNLSPKQTAREIKKVTGRTFREELTRTRLEMAELLSRTTKLSYTEISEAVGYSSYSGFYKAYCRRKEAH